MTRLLLALLLVALPAQARQAPGPTGDVIVAVPDTPVRADTTGPTPRGALIRGAIVPGWGHVYTRRYARLPFVYGALGGLVYAATWLGGEYTLYREAYQYKAYQELVDRNQIAENPRTAYADSYEALSARLGAVSSSVLKQRRDALRRNRDLSILATGVVWALSVLDAYVGAHLLDFDVSDDLSLRAAPRIDGPTPGAVLTYRWPAPR